MHKYFVVIALFACGGGQSAPAPTPKTPASTIATPAPSSSTPAPSPPDRATPAPSLDAPVTPAKTYDATTCKARVQTMKHRLEAAFKWSDASLSYVRYRTPVFGKGDSDLAPAPVTISLVPSRDQMAADWCGAWGIAVTVGNKDSVFDGKKRIGDAVALVKKRITKGARIGVRMMMNVPLHSVTPLLDELGKLGTLQLTIGVLGAEYALPMNDAPAWAVERVLAIQSTPNAPTEKLRAATRDAITTCEAMPAAFKKIAGDEGGNKGWVMAEELPRAAEKCGCAGVDVDALELFASYVLAGGIESVSDGYVELRIDPKSTTIVRATTEKELVAQLAGVTRDVRAKGVKLEIGEGPNPIPANLRDRCAR